MAEAKRNLQSKAEKMEKIVAGRQKFEAKGAVRDSTNEEKTQKYGPQSIMKLFSSER